MRFRTPRDPFSIAERCRLIGPLLAVRVTPRRPATVLHVAPGKQSIVRDIEDEYVLAVAASSLYRAHIDEFREEHSRCVAGGPQSTVGPILIPIFTLFSARRTSAQEVIWTPSAAGLFATLLALSVASWFLSAQLKSIDSTIIRDLQLAEATIAYTVW